jgi:hypothetical protein
MVPLSLAHTSLQLINIKWLCYHNSQTIKFSMGRSVKENNLNFTVYLAPGLAHKKCISAKNALTYLSLGSHSGQKS